VDGCENKKKSEEESVRAGTGLSLRMDGWTEMEHLQLGITMEDDTDVVV
jgi:hypothetical protein